ncbi:MAG: type II secretion system protein [Ilumatobacter sp.]|uniref:type II secretion system protein n=1 Tax=Ilumatobacter sp. TaxID=1967498 RepID=UPI002637C9B8|nr:type II secretion system protein [Ilumatobacter sp.]MDJ0771138.1 type II secretion system protein [Ilumatobacter sp.]
MTHRDHGYTLIEMIVVIVVLGLLTSVVVVAVTGIRTEAADSGCGADARQLAVAAEAYFAQTGASQIPSTGAGNDRFEQALVDGGFLRSASATHDLDADGTITTQGASSC